MADISLYTDRHIYIQTDRQTDMVKSTYFSLLNVFAQGTICRFRVFLYVTWSEANPRDSYECAPIMCKTDTKTSKIFLRLFFKVNKVLNYN